MSRDIEDILARYQSDRTRLLDILWDVQREYGHISEQAVAVMVNGLDMSAADIRETLSFYRFFHSRPAGRHTLYLSDTVIARMKGYDVVRAALERETGVGFGSVDESGSFGLFDTACIGLSDQEPAMMVDDVVFTRLTAGRVAEVVNGLKLGKTAAQLACPEDAACDSLAAVEAQAAVTVQRRGPVYFQPERDYATLLRHCLQMTPRQMIDIVTQSGLRGLGGAGFPTGRKWQMCNEADADEKYVICNADEGEPGTFKDRALLTCSPGDVLLGMIMAARATGACSGILYLRAEYAFLLPYLQAQVRWFREQGLLGEQIMDTAFSFDIRIQLGAGAYVCGEETALIESCEGKRGTPRLKPPYPILSGYRGKPTCINNVETLVAAGRIIEEGAAWYRAMGSGASAGTRLLSISGDCTRPGIYEIEWGTTLDEVLRWSGAGDAHAVQISGPAGESLSVAQERERVFCYSDLSCNGSLMVFDDSRDLLAIVRHFMAFFVAESCGICTPCRAGGIDLLDKIDRVIAGRASQRDLDEALQWGNLIRNTSRCGLGVSLPNPIESTLRKFPQCYQQSLVGSGATLLPGFDREAALKAYARACVQLMSGGKQ
jgi:[NiFe] hydrogenase diaphorase moiety large subunit